MPFSKSPVYAGMAVLPTRASNLATILPVIVPQLDFLHIHLNGGDLSLITPYVEEYGGKVKVSRTKRNQGDAEKIRKIADAPDDALFFTFDDDIAYPPDYVQHFRNEMSAVDVPGVMCVHGAIFNPSDPIAGYSGRMRMFDLEWPLEQTRRVMIPGTGTACTPLSVLRPVRRACRTKNMYDDWLACLAATNEIPVYTIRRPEGWLRRLPSVGDDICSDPPIDAMEALVFESRDVLKIQFAHLEVPSAVQSVQEDTEDESLIDVSPDLTEEEESAAQSEGAVVEADICAHCGETIGSDGAHKCLDPSRGPEFRQEIQQLPPVDQALEFEHLQLQALQLDVDVESQYAEALRGHLEGLAFCQPVPPPACGRGIVTVAGGDTYFPPAYVMIRSLREQGCTLPVHVYHLGPEELTPGILSSCEGLDVEFRDIYDVLEREDIAPFAEWELPENDLNFRYTPGWPAKALAILAAEFEEVLFLDSDNMVVRDPTYLFDHPAYKELGAVFWPDYKSLGKGRSIWKLCGLKPRLEVEFESGQMLINRPACWCSILTAVHLNINAALYYRHIHGDKDTFHMAWRICGQDYAMPDTPIEPLMYTMCQHDFEGRRVFQHRNGAKWSTKNTNPVVDGFMHEGQCVRYIHDYIVRTGPPVSAAIPEGVRRSFDQLRATVVDGGPWFMEEFGTTIAKNPIAFREDGTVDAPQSDAFSHWALEFTEQQGLLVVLRGSRAGEVVFVEDTGTTRTGTTSLGMKYRLRLGN